MAVRMVSFADGAFLGRAEHFIAESKEMEIYDSVKVYNFSSLPEYFREKHGEFMHAKKQGFGYWIWKPLIVLETLLTSNEDDVVIYSDVGFTQNAGGRDRMKEYLEIFRLYRYRMLSYYDTHTEAHWTKIDLAVRLGIPFNGVEMLTTQIAAGFFILMPTTRNVQIMQKWSDISVEDNYRYSDDSPSLTRNHPSFAEHRHDASIGSLIRKIEGTEITHYEVQGYDHAFENKKPYLPMLATRTGRIGPKP